LEDETGELVLNQVPVDQMYQAVWLGCF
jgi:hypothetical protein